MTESSISSGVMDSFSKIAKDMVFMYKNSGETDFLAVLKKNPNVMIEKGKHRRFIGIFEYIKGMAAIYKAQLHMTNEMGSRLFTKNWSEGEDKRKSLEDWLTPLDIEAFTRDPVSKEIIPIWLRAPGITFSADLQNFIDLLKTIRLKTATDQNVSQLLLNLSWTNPETAKAMKETYENGVRDTGATELFKDFTVGIDEAAASLDSPATIQLKAEIAGLRARVQQLENAVLKNVDWKTKYDWLLGKHVVLAKTARRMNQELNERDVLWDL
ncbi:hypothetical protein HDV00_008956 [Rhizophlyctis rosea]|nr:hypothetical protein HDV00_008956 [Rhizophlyctis rosea]